MTNGAAEHAKYMTNINSEKHKQSEPLPLKGTNSSYIIFPDEKETILSEGKYANVYLGADIHNKQHVICKELKPDLLDDEVAQIRFFMEASVSVKHPGIVKNHDLVKSEDGIYLIQEYVRGIDLKLALRSGMFTGDTGLSIRTAASILDALHAIHSADLIHRDIKPSNIVLEYEEGTKHINWQEPSVRIIDFGLAQNKKSGGYQAGRNPFSMIYSAPEVALRKDALIDERSDLYSLGLILYEMISGDPPYEADHPAKMLYKQINEPLKANRKIPDSLFNIIQKSCQKSRIGKPAGKMSNALLNQALSTGMNQRYPSAIAFKKALLHYLEHPDPPKKPFLKRIFNNNS